MIMSSLTKNVFVGVLTYSQPVRSLPLNIGTKTSLSVLPPARSVRKPRARAESTNTLSLSNVNAWRGVFERVRLTHDESPFGTSKFVSIGYGVERRRNV